MHVDCRVLTPEDFRKAVWREDVACHLSRLPATARSSPTLYDTESARDQLLLSFFKSTCNQKFDPWENQESLWSFSAEKEPKDGASEAGEWEENMRKERGYKENHHIPSIRENVIDVVLWYQNPGDLLLLAALLNP